MEFILLYLLYAIGLSFALKRRGAQSTLKTPETKENIVADRRPERILVIGATGGTGRQVVGQLLEKDYEVTAFVRKPSKLQMTHPKLKLARGDVMDYESVEKAVEGQDAVLSALGHKRFFYPTRILSEGTGNLIRAMQKFDVGRFVCETSLGIGGSAGRMGLYYTLFTIPVILPFYFWDKARQETLISGSALKWTIVRPGVLTNKAGKGGYRHGPKIGSYIRTVRISRADVATFMIEQLTDNTYHNRTVGVAG